MSGHTPEKWCAWYSDYRDCYTHIVLEDNEEVVIAEMTMLSDGSDAAEVSTRCRVAAAAPELKEALEALVKKLLDYESVNNLAPNPGRKYCWDETERAIAALARTNGEAG